MHEPSGRSPGALRPLLRALVVAAVVASGGAAAHRLLGLEVAGLVAVAPACAGERCSPAAELADAASFPAPRRDAPAPGGGFGAAPAPAACRDAERLGRAAGADPVAAVEPAEPGARAPPARA